YLKNGVEGNEQQILMRLLFQIINLIVFLLNWLVCKRYLIFMGKYTYYILHKCSIIIELLEYLRYNLEKAYDSIRGMHIVKTKQLRVKNNKFHMIADEEMLQLIHDGDSQGLDFLIDRYRGFVLAKARSYFLIGGDSEDIIQEGMIGLYKAICDFDSNKYTSFKGFANLCITRQMITAIKTATRQKHMPLNTSVSLDKPVYDEESERTLIDIIVGSEGVDP